MKKYLPFCLIFIFTVLFYFPIIKSPTLLVDRENDLTEFFWPIFYFVRESIYKYHQLPFWNNLFFSGTPLLPDPQAPIFYLPNIIFLFLKNIDLGFEVSVFFHIFMSGISMYLLSKFGFRFSKRTSLFCAFIYIASPKLSGYIEAGHFGLITSWTFLPLAFLATILLSRKPTLNKSIFLALILSFLFYTHILIFAIMTITSFIFYLYKTIKNKKNIFTNLSYFFISGIFCFGLTAIAFLPQLNWQQETTRSLLLGNPDVYPKWISIKEFMISSLSPIFLGPKFIWGLDTEKTIALGFFTTILGFFGFIKLKKGEKFFLLVSLSLITALSLNNISPIYDYLIKQNWYILLRVSTRFWFITVFISIFLAGFGLETLLQKKKYNFLIYVIALFAIIELLTISWTRITKPISTDTNLVPKQVYEFLSQDKSQFRVFCLNRCLSQKETAIYGLELAEGYGTLQQKNYYEISEQISQSFYRNRYTLSIPPFEIFEYEKLQPYSPNLSAYNIKYIISNHLLKDKNLKLIKQIDEYLIYQNEINKPRANYPITSYSPNLIRIDTSNYNDNKIILSEVYNKDWIAYLNGKIETKITETLDKTREVEINEKTKYVSFTYYPVSFKFGLLITFTTIGVILSIFILNFKFFKKKK